MRDLMISLFGVYSPVQYVTTAGETIIPSGAAGVDWTFVLGVSLFSFFAFSCFKVIGGVFNAILRH